MNVVETTQKGNPVAITMPLNPLRCGCNFVVAVNCG